MELRNRQIAIAVIGGGIGGGQRVALSVASGLLEQGGHPFFVSPTSGPLLNEARALGCPTHVIGSPLLRDIRSIRSIARLLQSSAASLLYTHTVPTHESILSAAAARADIPTVIHRHNIAPFSSQGTIRGIQIRLWRAAIRRASEVVSVSPQVQNDLESLTGRRGRLVWNGVRIPPRVEHQARRPVVIGFVGRADPHKGLNKFLEAVDLLHPMDRDARFLVIGSHIDKVPTPDRERAHRLQKVEALRFAGPVAGATESLAGMDVLLMPSRLEGHPLVLLEAMARGKPVIAFDIPGCRESIVDGETGMLVKAGDVRALAEAASLLVEDDALRQRMGRAARRRAEDHFAEPRMVDEILPILAAAVRNSSPTR